MRSADDAIAAGTLLTTSAARGIICRRVAIRVRRYGFACLAVLLAFAVRLALDPALGNRQTLATFYVAVTLTAWWAGTGPAILALVLGYVVGDWFFIPPRGELSVWQPSTAEAGTT